MLRRALWAVGCHTVGYLFGTALRVALPISLILLIHPCNPPWAGTAGKYKVNRTLVACGSDFVIESNGAGYMSWIMWDKNAPPPASGLVFATGPGAGCTQTNFTIRYLYFTGAPNGGAVLPLAGLDFVVARTPHTPPTPTGRYAAQALQLPWNSTGAPPGRGDATNAALGSANSATVGALAAALGGAAGAAVLADWSAFAPFACAPVRLHLDSVFFGSPAGGLFLGLQEGDVISTGILDGRVEIVDSDRAAFVSGFLNTDGMGGIVIHRHERAEDYWQRPCIAGRQAAAAAASSLARGLPGVTGAVTMAAAATASGADVFVYNSSR